MVTVKYTPNWALLSKSESSTLSASRKRGAQVAQNGPGKSCKSCDNAFGTFDPISSQEGSPSAPVLDDTILLLSSGQKFGVL